MGCFAELDIDVTFLESRPTGVPWSYRFVLEIVHRSLREGRAALDDAREHALEISVLGTFASG